MTSLELDMQGVRSLQNALRDTSRKLPSELAIAINATSRKVQSTMSKQVREELAVKAKDMKKVLGIKRKANRARASAMVQLDYTRRLSLKAFGARQVRNGISYRISKKGGRQKMAGGFMGPKPGVTAVKLGGHAYKRRGKSRLPIVKLHGASPWGSYTKKHMRPRTIREGNAELTKQIDRRIRFNLLKKQKLI